MQERVGKLSALDEERETFWREAPYATQPSLAQADARRGQLLKTLDGIVKEMADAESADKAPKQAEEKAIRSQKHCAELMSKLEADCG